MSGLEVVANQLCVGYSRSFTQREGAVRELEGAAFRISRLGSLNHKP